MSELDKSEYQRIEAAIRATEQAMAGNPHIRSDAAAAALEPGKKRMDALEQQGFAPHQADEDRKKQGNMAVAIATLVMRETRLNAQEKQTYGSFLQKDFFTRNDFGNLEDFYADDGAWDKLSKRGKEEMSTRVWAGIERGEYTFSELPDSVRKKETEQLYEYLKEPGTSPAFVERIDSEVRESFKREYEAGNLEAAQQILDLHGVKLDSVTKEQNQAATERSEVAAGGVKENADKTEVESSKEEKPTAEESQLSLLASISPADIKSATSGDRSPS